MVELEVKLGSKTGLDTVQNEKHVEEEVAPPDDSNQVPLVRVTWRLHEAVCAPGQKIRVSEFLSARICIYMGTSVLTCKYTFVTNTA